MFLSKPQLPTVGEIDRLLSVDKTTVNPMVWEKRKERRGKEYKTVIFLQEQGAIKQGLRIVAKYTELPPPFDPVFNFVLLLNNRRVYAVDIDPPHKQHFNSDAGAGRSFYQKSVPNTHEHLWSKEGEGYAEPLLLPKKATHKDYWLYFSSKTNIKVKGGYRHPQETNIGQMNLL